MALIDFRHTTRWVAATVVALAAACGSNPGGPTRPTGPTGPATSAPEIACPSDVTVRSVTGASLPVTYTAALATGGAAPVTVTCSPESGSMFPLGSTSVNCAASDAQARQAACSFRVTLTGAVLSVTKYDALGDSLTEGQNGHLAFKIVDVPNAYPTKLQLLLDLNYPDQPITVINHGTGGKKIDFLVSTLPGFIAEDKPGAVLFFGGFNNLTDSCPPGSSLSSACDIGIGEVAGGVRDIIRHSKERGVPIVFVSTLTPPGPSGSRRINGDAIIQADSRIRQTVAAEGGILVDVYPLFQGHEAEYVDTDGLHLRPAGYQAVAEAFLAAIKTTLPANPLVTAAR
jgi:lysophospholipase L1-like esterase